MSALSDAKTAYDEAKKDLEAKQQACLEAGNAQVTAQQVMDAAHAAFYAAADVEVGVEMKAGAAAAAVSVDLKAG